MSSQQNRKAVDHESRIACCSFQMSAVSIKLMDDARVTPCQLLQHAHGLGKISTRYESRQCASNPHPEIFRTTTASTMQVLVRILPNHNGEHHACEYRLKPTTSDTRALHAGIQRRLNSSVLHEGEFFRRGIITSPDDHIKFQESTDLEHSTAGAVFDIIPNRRRRQRTHSAHGIFIAAIFFLWIIVRMLRHQKGVNKEPACTCETLRGCCGNQTALGVWYD